VFKFGKKMHKLLITGGCGFIGTNAAEYFSNTGWEVTIVDNLSRVGADQNLKWLQSSFNISFKLIDMRNEVDVLNVINMVKPDMVLHLAGQVAVTQSINNPREDFSINALGTFNILEAIRLSGKNTFFINASTNKVYGSMKDIDVIGGEFRYQYTEFPNGIDEKRCLDFHSPYGCSKGAADQYTTDYARIYGLNTVNFRQSCIYGPRQFGIEDQGWVAWFIIAATLGKKITIYGDGKQVRDVLHVSDLIRAYEAAFNNRNKISGESFNIGGGRHNCMSLLDLISYIENHLGCSITLNYGDWRSGDQPIFICNIDKAKKFLDWVPAIPVEKGVNSLSEWVGNNKKMFNWLK